MNDNIVLKTKIFLLALQTGIKWAVGSSWQGRVVPSGGCVRPSASRQDGYHTV